MALQPFAIEKFAGLNLADDPLDVGPTGAVDLLNVDVDQSGRITTRDGYTQLVDLSSTTPNAIAAYDTTAGVRQIIVGFTESGDAKLRAYTSAGVSVATTTTPTSDAVNAVQFGTSSGEYLYIANGADTIWRWVGPPGPGAAFSQPAGMPIATYLAITSLSNRLVAANITGTNVSRVMFSDPGAPETWGANNYVEVAPSDGSMITGLASWQDFVIATKVGRFFVFYGESTDADGEPIFNYRAVDGFGSIVQPTAGDEGVYMYDGRTIWLTTGGIPRRVSRVVEPFLRGEATLGGSSALTPNAGLSTQTRLHYALGRLYVTVRLVSGGYTTLVYDPAIDQWTLYDLTAVGADVAMKSIVTLRPAASTDQAQIFALSSDGYINQHDPTVTTDNGSAITWAWQSGVYSPTPDRVAISLETSVIGTGIITCSTDTELYPNQGSSSPVTLVPVTEGAIPAEGWVTGSDQEGKRWSHTLNGSGPASVERVTHFLGSAKPAGVQ